VYGWRGTLLIEAGLLFNCCVCAAFYLSPSAVTPTPPSSAELLDTVRHLCVQQHLNQQSDFSFQVMDGYNVTIVYFAFVYRPNYYRAVVRNFKPQMTHVGGHTSIFRHSFL